VSGEEFELLYDESLDMLVTHPQPERISNYYESDAYISHTDANRTLIDKLYQAVKRYSLTKKMKLISRYAGTDKTLLDYGAGTGDFLVRAESNGWIVTGVEPNSTARQNAAQKGMQLQSELIANQDQKYQVITLWHVLEHLPDLDQKIEMLVGLLKQGGTLVIAVPNFKSFDAKYYKEFWAAYDVPRHLWHFSKYSVEKLFAAHGLNLQTIKPMLFDAFYVSLLSERNKSNKQHFIKAMCLGLWSNLKAWKSKEYSSHIYILKKA